MKQIIQNYKSGELQLVEVPDPIIRQGGVILETKVSLVSVGTEKLMINLAQKGYLGKALARPDLVKQVINKIKVDGLVDAYKSVMGRLDTPVTLGYSSAGVAKEVGAGVSGIRIGDRLACFGDGFATHSELSYVPMNMLVKIPENVSLEEASFVGLGAIALNAIRVAKLTFGEKVAVVGLGLLGQLTVQMLKAFGCQVIGIDISESKIKMALEFGADRSALIGKEDVKEAVADFTGGVGVDAVIIMAGSQDNKPIELAAEIARDKGRVVACGMVSLDVPRQEFFKKELSLIVSRATGPGKFDPLYENKGIDYPLPFVRWTTQRNMGCFLDLINTGKVRLSALITHKFEIERALQAYDMILKGSEPYLGVLIKYQGSAEVARKVRLKSSEAKAPVNTEKKELGVGLIGAGLHANTNMLPVLKKTKGYELIGIADADGFKGKHTGKKYGFDYCTADYHELLADPDIDVIMIATRHNLHARMIIDALNADKQVFVEKPLAMNNEELNEIAEVYGRAGRQLMVGFNRRFAPLTTLAKSIIGSHSDMVINCRVNAGYVPAESWVHDAQEGGGRVIGEVCHFVDLIQYLSGSIVARLTAEGTDKNGQDNLVITLKMANGSVATILYASQGDRLLPRERIEVFSGKAVCVIDNFKSLFSAKDGKVERKKSFNLDRGYAGEFNAFLAAIKTGKPPVNFADYFNTTAATFAISEAIKSGRTQTVNEYSNSL
jgi:predicted dehydrogenase/threonine dehydrogenase-like Zn-dependent dehydrogenase